MTAQTNEEDQDLLLCGCFEDFAKWTRQWGMKRPQVKRN